MVNDYMMRGDKLCNMSLLDFAVNTYKDKHPWDPQGVECGDMILYQCGVGKWGNSKETGQKNVLEESKEEAQDDTESMIRLCNVNGVHELRFLNFQHIL